MDDTDVNYVPAREEVIVLSNEGSDESHEGLIHRSTCAGPPQGTVNEPVNEPVDDVETPVDTAEQLETRKKKRGDKPEKKKAEEPVSEAPRKTPSNLSFLDYVVVSNTLSGLDGGVKRSERDPDDDATLTEIAKKEKLLEDKKKELDARAAAALAEKKSKLQKETATAPSESEIDLGVFSVKLGNLLEKMFSLVLVPEKGKWDDVEVEHMEENVAADLVGDEGRKDGVETEVESSETTPNATIYTKRLPSAGGGGTSGTRQSPEYQHVEGASWDTHNPACEDLPHAPRWKLTQGSRMNNIDNCREEREKYNAEKKGLLWRVSDAEDKLLNEKQFNENKQKEWEIACEQTNCEMQNARDQIVKLKESKASEILAEETAADCKWLLARAVPLISERIAKSDELARYMYELGEVAYNNGRNDGYAEGKAATSNNEKDYHFPLYKEDCVVAYAAKLQEYEFIKFGIVKAVGKLSRKANAVEVLKQALGDQDPEGCDTGPSRQD
ncbi:hypothetical protein Hanom_Chr12g01076941 [Helianthus anomalus]